ncbi:8011_t:CDS:2, partial [Racocetra persica]
MPKTKPGYYAVRKGCKPGIYLTWDEYEAQVNKFHNAMYKKFSIRIEVQKFIEGKYKVSKDNDPNNLSERLPGSEQTNNRAEIYAAIRALEVCENKIKPLEIMTDNLIKRLKKLIDNRIGTVRLIHVRGHLGNYGNEQADRLAKLGSLQEAIEENPKLEI